MSLVNDSLKFTSSDIQICWNILLKNVSSFCSAKATHIFSAKNIRILYIESAKTVNEMTLNELVKLTMLWTTGPWFILAMVEITDRQGHIISYKIACAPNEDSDQPAHDQPAHSCRLTWIFTGRTCKIVGIAVPMLKCFWEESNENKFNWVRKLCEPNNHFVFLYWRFGTSKIDSPPANTHPSLQVVVPRRWFWYLLFFVWPCGCSLRGFFSCFHVYLFVCVEVLRPSQPNWVMSCGQST